MYVVSPHNLHNRTNFTSGRVAITALIVLLGAFMSLGGSTASAAPGSAVDQYVEQIPEVGGNELPPKDGSGDPSKHLGKKVHQRFKQYGTDGAAAAALAAAVPAASTSLGTTDTEASPPTKSGSAAQVGAKPRDGSGVAVASEEPGISDVVGAAIGTSGGGSGPLLPLIAVIVVLAMAAAGFSRHRRTERSEY